jgi:uncharacterized protein (DUF362 family)
MVKKMPKGLNQSKKADPKVAITKTDIGIKKAVRESLDRIGGIDKFIKKGETVFVKPNLTGDRDPSTAAVTNPEVTKALIEIIYDRNPKEVLLGDSPSWGFDSEKVYDITGVRKVAEETGCTLVNLDKDKRIECVIDHGERLKKTQVAKTILDCDKLINVPVMKTHMQCVVSLGLKNMKGILPLRWKAKVHDLEPKNGCSGLNIGIADLHKLIRPDLTVVDGTVGMEGRGPFDGDPVKMDLIISGEDAVLVDSVCATIMGFDPGEIPAIKSCAEHDAIDWKSYQIVGLPIDEVKRSFKPCPTEVYAGENIKVITGVVCTGCLATLNTAIHRLMKKDELEDVRNLIIAIGKDPKIPLGAERVLYLGKCAVEGELLQTVKELHSVKGCPPTGWGIIEGVKKFE